MMMMMMMMTMMMMINLPHTIQTAVKFCDFAEPYLC